jgi:hypothetical protein
MESLILSQKSSKDIKDPVLKDLLSDIRTIVQAELLQATAASQNPEKKSRMAARPAFAEFDEMYSQMGEARQQHVRKTTKKFNTPAFKTKLSDLGIELSNATPASEQVDYEKIFKAYKGKGEKLSTQLENVGRRTIVPFSLFPDPDVSNLIEKVKQTDRNTEGYADYMALLDKDKLIELYEREVGKITDKEAFFEAHEPSLEEATKIRRTVTEWQKRGPNDPAKYKNSLLRLIVSRVLCIDETEHDGFGEGVANDRIDLSAMSFSPNGQSTVFGPQIVSDNFQDGRQFFWNREVARFNLLSTSLPKYPLNFGVSIAISEIDFGAGFANTVGEIWRIARPIVVEVVKKIGEILGAIIGSGEVGGYVGKVIGELIALALNDLINIVKRAVEDDVFDPMVATIRLDSPYSTFMGVFDKLEGPFRSPEQEITYIGFGGTYRVYYFWELSRVLESGTPTASVPSGQTLQVTTQTANDDLRGYNRAFLTLNFTDGTSSREYPLHQGQAATQLSTKDINLDNVVTLNSIRSVTIRHDGTPNNNPFNGGDIGHTYDNWDLMSLQISLGSKNIYNSANDRRARNAEGNLFRFTGSNRTLRVFRQI